ncbi:MAG: hypothetical protein ACXVPU_02735 [Bacteroidia bacterium]
MRSINIIYSYFLKNTSVFFFIFLIIFTIDRHHRYEVSTDQEKYGPFESDMAEYYSYLPSVFYQSSTDAAFNFKSNKRTIGMAIMFAPAFLVGDIIASHSGEKRNGYSAPYKWSVRWGSILVCIAGLLFCRKSLKLFFKDTVVTISLACIFFGTNLFFYTYCIGELPHCYLFFLYSVFIFCTLRLILHEKHSNIIWIGLIGGLITLIRPTDVIILLFPLLYKCKNLQDFKIRMKLFCYNYFLLTCSIILFLLPLVLQMITWKIYIGKFIYYSYTDERFFFTDPQIINFLFSYQKGWLLYTPMMIFSIAGILLAKKYLNDFFIFLILFTALSIYVLSCWWDWSFGGSFGCRAMVQSYSVLIFPFAVFVSWCFLLFEKVTKLKLILKTLLITLLFIVIQFNLFQTWQYRWIVIPWSGMNKKIYNYIFLKDNVTKEDLIYIYSIRTPPDVIKMKRGERD